MKALSAFHRYWLSEPPLERLAALRIIIGLFAVIYVLARTAHFIGYAYFPARNFAPVGVVSLLDSPTPAWVHLTIYGACLLCGALFVCGAHYRISAPIFALSFLWLTTYRSSWGMIFHQDNLAALHLLVLAPSNAHAAWSYDASKRSIPSARGYGWPIRAIGFVTVAAYVLAGIAKIKNVGWDWGTGDVLRTHIAYDALRKLELGGTHSPVGAWLVQFDSVFPVLGMLTLLLELGAPLALLGGRLRTAWVAGIWSFHLGVIVLMAITFAYPVSGCAFASFFAVEKLRYTRLVRKFWPTRLQEKP